MKPSTLKRAALLGLLALLWGCQPNTTATAAAPQLPTHTSDWKEYYQQSQQLRQIDRDFLQAELASIKLSEARLPSKLRNAGFDPQQPLEWYRSSEARALAEAIMSFQTPSGGWSKNTDMSRPRTPGTAFGTEAGYIPTFDNDATIAQLWFLAHIRHATDNPAYEDAFYRDVTLLLAAQYPNGGWPQNYPLTGSYHDHITLNDEVLTNILSLLKQAAQAEPPFDFVKAEVRQLLEQSVSRALLLIPQMQVRNSEGELTVWGAQHHARSLQPTAARKYEPASLSSSESAHLLGFLMTVEKPSEELIEAIHSGVAWLKRHAINEARWERGTALLVADPQAKGIWPRFMDIETGRGLFGDRDGKVYDELGEISAERLRGYGWYSTAPLNTFKRYQKWAKRFPRTATHQ